VTARLPFALAPLDEELFEVWLHAYAARLAMAPDQLADALGLPARRGHGTATRPPAEQLTSICTATGLEPPAVAAMFAPCGPALAPRLLQAWMPQRTTRFCPACLTENPGQMPAAWSLPVTFFCLRHGQLLASRCPQCSRRPASLAGPSRSGRCTGPDGCGDVLGTARPPACSDIPAARQAQEAISDLTAGVRDPARTAASRRQALGQLTDLTIIACHVAAGDPRRRPARSVTLLSASTLTTAFALLTVRPGTRDADPLASLATPVPPGAVPPAVPLTWHGATPALRARVARARDAELRPSDRLRYATTLPEPLMPVPRPAGQPDLAAVRAARLPDQLWPDWAVRLSDDGTVRHDKLLPAALVALLLPHSDMPLHQITALVSSRLHRHVIGFQMGKLTTATGVLRILTELALALDAHDIPVNYQRRRDLAARTTLLDDATWARMIREAGMRLPPITHARRYLYELLTGCSLQNAPPPYRVTSTGSQARYDDFAIGMPAPLATALTVHARRQLDTWGIGDEPLQWQPPASWVTATTWPGADPASTDPAPIHHGLLREQATPGQVAASLGISPGHLRQVLRRHPLPRPRRPVLHTLIPAAAPASPPSGQQPGVIYLDPAWLREEYLTWQRSLNDIATQIGCPVQTLSTFARDRGIPVRPRGSQIGIASRAAPGRHPRDLPEPLRSALAGRNARRSLHSLLVISEYASIHQAARDLGIWPSTLYQQLGRMEHACGGPLIHRSPRRAGPGALTPLGQLLSQQAGDYLDPRPVPGRFATVHADDR
jgi:hypothetical protein